MDRDIAVKIADALADIKVDFDDIVTSLETIAQNTTPETTTPAESAGT